MIRVMMRDDTGDTLIPGGQIIQINTEQGEIQYLQVTNENGETQYIQLSSDGQAEFVLEPVEPVEDAVASSHNEDNVLEIKSEAGNDVILQYVSEEAMPQAGEMQNEDVVGLISSTDNLDHVPLQQCAEDESSMQCQSTEGAGTPVYDSIFVEQAKKSQGSDPLIPDLSSPIDLQAEQIVTINSKKCLLKMDPETGKMRAYPLKWKTAPGKRPRGRPRKPQNADECSKDDTENMKGNEESAATEVPNIGPTEQENSAAQGLLGLSIADGRRKSLRVKKKPQVLSEYEIGAIEGVEDHEEDDGAKPSLHDDELVPVGLRGTEKSDFEKRQRGRPKTSTTNQVQNFLANLGLPVKRGRGRPRRYPPSGMGSMSSIGTFVIKGNSLLLPNDKTVTRPVVNIQPKLTDEVNDRKAESSKFPPIIIQNADGTRTHIVNGKVLRRDANGVEITNSESKTESATVTNESYIPLKADGETVEEKTNKIDGDDSLTEERFISEFLEGGYIDEKTGVIVESLQNNVEMNSDIESNEDNGLSQSEDLSHATATIKLPGYEGGMDTIIHVPQNFVPLLLSGKSEEPIKIGLKQTEGDLEKLKCTKCDYQAYYIRQFQEHIAEKHADEAIKCKCCYYACFDEDSLTSHYREVHPKNCCTVCDFRAEHAYVVKRHMMRHNSDGCSCSLCGKTYKDRYILKMHVKMVHMPAEVLFECDVCAKKFTRKAHLKRHIRIHDPEKPFKCPLCEYRGCERSDITKHLVIHNEPRYPCEVCGKFFRHMKNKELHLKRHKGQRDYKCGMCDFYGYTFTDIRKHIDRRHADAKIICDKCGCIFRSETLLTEHAATCSNGLLTTIESGNYSVMGSILSDDGTTIQIPTSQISADGQMLLDSSSSQDYICVEQVHLNDDDNVSLSDVQITEASMNESRHVEQNLAHGQIITVKSSGFVDDMVSIPHSMEQHIIMNNASHIQISETGQLLKIESHSGDLTESDLSEVQLVEAGEFKDDALIVHSSYVTNIQLQPKKDAISILDDSDMQMDTSQLDSNAKMEDGLSIEEGGEGCD